MLPDATLRTVFLDEPYSPEKNHPSPDLEKQNFGTPTRISTASQLRKRHLDKVSDSPPKNFAKTEYGKCPLSQEAIKYKQSIDSTTGRNVSFTLYDSPNSKKIRYTRAVTQGCPGGTHSELRTHDKVPPNRKKFIKLVYTERKPCHLCQKKIKAALGAVFIAWSCDHKSEELSFQKKQALLGVRVPKGKKL